MRKLCARELRGSVVCERVVCVEHLNRCKTST